MTIQLEILIGIISIFLAIGGFFIGRQSSAKIAGIRDGALDTKIEYLKNAVDEIKEELRETNLAALKNSVEETKKYAEREIARLDKRIDDMRKL